MTSPKKIILEKKLTEDLQQDLEFAIKNSLITEIKNILNQKPNVNFLMHENFGGLLFFSAIKTVNEDVIDLFLGFAKNYPDKADINMLDQFGNNALVHLSLFPFNHKLVSILAKKLIKAGVDPFHTAKDGYTVLHAAATSNNIPLMKILLNLGLNPDVIFTKYKNFLNIAPIHIAALKHNLGMIKLLVSYCANTNLLADQLNETTKEPSGMAISVKQMYVKHINDLALFDYAVLQGLAIAENNAVKLSHFEKNYSLSNSSELIPYFGKRKHSDFHTPESTKFSKEINTNDKNTKTSESTRHDKANHKKNSGDLGNNPDLIKKSQKIFSLELKKTSYKHPDLKTEKQIHKEIITEVEQQLNESSKVINLTIKLTSNTTKDISISLPPLMLEPVPPSLENKVIEIPFALNSEPLLIGDIILSNDNNFLEFNQFAPSPLAG